MLKALILARTGFDAISAKSYQEILHGELTSWGVNVEDWSGDVIPQSNDEEMLLLTHWIDIDDTEEEAVLTAAKQGAMVVKFSGGLVGKREDETERSILIMGWEDLRQALTQVRNLIGHAPPALDTIRRALGVLNERSVLNALAILSWCATYEFDSEILRQEQKKWRSRDKWLQVFQDVTRKEFLCACGVSSESDLPATLRYFLNWLWPKIGNVAGKPPEFEQIFHVLKMHFGLRCGDERLDNPTRTI